MQLVQCLYRQCMHACMHEVLDWLSLLLQTARAASIHACREMSLQLFLWPESLDWCIALW